MFLTIAETAGQQGAGGLLSMFAPMLLVFGVFYFLLIRPQQKQQKKLAAMVEALRRGDTVVTRSGMHGTIANIDDKTVMIQVANNVQIKFNKDQVAFVAAGNSKDKAA